MHLTKLLCALRLQTAQSLNIRSCTTGADVFMNFLHLTDAAFRIQNQDSVDQDY